MQARMGLLPSPFMQYPKIIQGGMGVAVSSWTLARAVSMEGQLGVVSGTGIDTILTRRLQLGDIGGHIREALTHFPNKEAAERIVERYFIDGGKKPDAPFKAKPVPSLHPTLAASELIVAANFVEVFLAKRGHNGLVGINLLEKIQLPTLPSLFGAMLAGVDFVLMGAGIPRAIPGVLDLLVGMNPVRLETSVTGAKAGMSFATHLQPTDICPNVQGPLKRPEFLAIISSTVLALTLARKSTGKVQGFVVEGATAGGHNAPPRGELTLTEEGEPIYGPRDIPDLEQIKELGLPFWLAGSYGTADGLRRALELGATGVQVGTAFAFCQESGIDPAIKQEVIERSRKGTLQVFTDPLTSPTGFPFKVVRMAGTTSEEPVYKARPRVCDLGYLRELYVDDKGKVAYRCPSEPVEDYVKKGGERSNTEGRKCICNGLLVTAGMGQRRKGEDPEPAIVTAGDDINRIAEFLEPGETGYPATRVIERLLSPKEPEPARVS